MTQGENVRPCPRKKKKEDQKKTKKKKVPDQRLGENKEEKKRKSLIKDNERIIQKGLRTRQISKQYGIVTTK